MAGVTWRVGGLKSASGRLSWNPQKAFTGFWKGTRKFEEPNPFSTLNEHLFASGYRAYVDADSSFVTDHRALIDVVMFSSVLQSHPLAPRTTQPSRRYLHAVQPHRFG